MIFSDIRLRLANRKLRSLPGRQIAFVSKGHIRKVGVILDDLNEEVKIAFEALADSLQIKAADVVFVYCSGSEGVQQGEERIIFRFGDIGWSGRIINPGVSRFLEEDLDLLICFTREDNPLATYLMAACGAGLKVGRQAQPVFDLSISTSVSEIGIFTLELKKYLRLINKTA